MNSGVNWSRLYTQDRCKSIGIPWNEEEARAVFALKIPADYVRQGCLTLEAYEAARGKREDSEKKTGKIALVHLKRNQLVALCDKYGIRTTDDALKPILVEALLQAGAPKSIAIEDVPKAED